MFIQRNPRVISAILSIAIAATSVLQSGNETGQAVEISVQPHLTQKQRSAPTQEKYVTRLFDLSGKQLAQFEGEMYRFISNGQRVLTQLDIGSGHYYLFDVSGKELLQFESRTVEFSPDGERILNLLQGKDYFQFYDGTGKKLAQLPGKLERPIFSQNGQQIVTFTEESAYLFDASGRQIAQMQGRFRGFGSGFGSNGQGFILYREDPTTCNLFNSSGQVIAQLRQECAGVSPKGKKFLAGSGGLDNPSVDLYDFTGKKIARLKGMFGFFTFDEQFILTTDVYKGNSSYLYHSTGKEIARLKGKNGRFSPNGKRLVTVSGSTVYLYDLSGKELAQVPGNQAAFLPKGDKFVTFLFGVNKDSLDISGGESRLFDSSGRELALLKGDFDLSDIVVNGAGSLPPFLDELYTRSLRFFSSDGQRIFTSDSKNSYLYDASGKQIAKLPGLARSFSSTGQHLILASEGKVRVFDRAGNQLMEIPGEYGVFSPDGQRIAITTKK